MRHFNVTLPRPPDTPTKHTSISRWILLRMALLLVLLGLLSSGFSVILLDHNFDHFDEGSFIQEMERVSVAFALESTAMAATIRDYAYWDDAERFVLGDAPEFLEQNFSPESLRNLGYSAFAFTTLNGQFIASQMVAAKGRMISMPQKLREKLQAIVLGCPQNGLSNSTVTMVWIDGQASLVTVAPVTDTARKNEPSGYMFFVRAIDSGYLGRLRSITSSGFSLIETPAGRAEPVRVGEYWRNGEERFEASMPLAGLPASIVVDGTTRMGKERAASYAIPALNIVLMVLAALGGIYLILHRRVLKRLRLFSRLTDRYHDEGDLRIRWPVGGRDELDRLAVSLNDLLSQVERQHDDLEHRLEHDTLTHIGNRVRLLSRLTEMQHRASRVHQSTGSLLMIDLDGFKEINDDLGHAAGDEVLIVVARRIREPVRDYDTVARLGGDEFAVLLQDVEAQDSAPFAQRILKLIEQPIEVDGHQVSVGCSIGIARITAQSSPDEVLRNADQAMYEAKRLGKGGFVQFDAAILDRARTPSRQAPDAADFADCIDVGVPLATPAAD